MVFEVQKLFTLSKSNFSEFATCTLYNLYNYFHDYKMELEVTYLLRSSSIISLYVQSISCFISNYFRLQDGGVDILF